MENFPRRWSTVAGAARYSGFAVRTIRQRIADGDLPAYKPRGSRELRVDLADVDELITSGRDPLAERIRRIVAERGGELPDLTDEQVALLARLLCRPVSKSANDDAAA